jgi:hypothetical protein
MNLILKRKGEVKMREYIGNDNHGQPKQKYLNEISKMTDEKLHDETRHKIWLSAFATNNPKSDYHWMVDALYDEWCDNRLKPEGYKKAYDEEYKESFG